MVSLIVVVGLGAVAGAAVAGGSWWILSKLEASQKTTAPSPPADAVSKQERGITEPPTPNRFASVRIAYSSRQVLEVSNVPGEYNQILNLDNIGSLRLSAPFNREAVTLSRPMSPPVTVTEPKSGEKYKVPNSDQTFRFDDGTTARGLTLVGQAQRITFDAAHPVHFIRVGERIFRVSLESVRDKTNPERIFWFEYDFAISEEEPTPENRAAATTEENPTTAEVRFWAKDYPDGVKKLLTVMKDQSVGTIELRLLPIVDGRPNVVQLSAGTKSFQFDPTARIVRFHMVTNTGRPVDLHLPLEGPSPIPDGSYFIAFAWDNSKGASLHVNDKVSNGGV